MGRGVSHTEFIRAPTTADWCFLETSARVGGAFIVDTIEAATGINLWREWAKIEIAGEERRVRRAAASRRLRRHRPVAGAAGRARHVALHRPRDRAADSKHHHAGLIVRTADSARLDDLLARYADRFHHEFMAWHPAPDTPTA